MVNFPYNEEVPVEVSIAKPIAEYSREELIQHIGFLRGLLTAERMKPHCECDAYNEHDLDD